MPPDAVQVQRCTKSAETFTFCRCEAEKHFNLFLKKRSLWNYFEIMENV